MSPVSLPPDAPVLPVGNAVPFPGPGYPGQPAPAPFASGAAYGQDPYPGPPPGYGPSGNPPGRYGPGGYGEPTLPPHGGGYGQVASLGARIGGYLLDRVIAFIGVFIVGFVIGFSSGVGGAPIVEGPFSGLNILLGLLGFFLVFILPTGLSGRTVGKLAAGTKVLDMKTGQQASWGQVWGRYALLYLIAMFVLPGLIMLIFMGRDPYCRGWHDRAAGTIVVSV